MLPHPLLNFCTLNCPRPIFLTLTFFNLILPQPNLFVLPTMTLDITVAWNNPCFCHYNWPVFPFPNYNHLIHIVCIYINIFLISSAFYHNIFSSFIVRVYQGVVPNIRKTSACAHSLSVDFSPLAQPFCVFSPTNSPKPPYSLFTIKMWKKRMKPLTIRSQSVNVSHFCLKMTEPTDWFIQQQIN